MKSQRTYACLDEVVGKTIERVWRDEDGSYAVLIYTDGSYTSLFAGDLDDSPINRDWDDEIPDDAFIYLGIHTAEDIADYRANRERIKAQQERESDLRRLEQLKKKLGVK